MAVRLCRMLLLLLCWFASLATVRAQDFSVYTNIYDEHASAKGPAKAQPIARSLTLFHAGKVFDFPNGTQVTIFEPAHEQFTIIDNPRKLMTTITFDEIQTLIHQHQTSTEVYAKRMLKDRFPEAGKKAPHFLFQLAPKFQEAYDAEKHLLTLKSPQLNYEVKCDESQPPEVIEVYLRYADWASRLSYLSRPHALLPGPRLALDEVLRRRNLLPTEVVLRSEPFPALHLKAVHTFTWRFDATNRRTITDWEDRSKSRELERVPFEVFLERTALVAQQKGRDSR